MLFRTCRINFLQETPERIECYIVLVEKRTFSLLLMRSCRFTRPADRAGRNSINSETHLIRSARKYMKHDGKSKRYTQSSFHFDELATNTVLKQKRWPRIYAVLYRIKATRYKIRDPLTWFGAGAKETWSTYLRRSFHKSCPSITFDGFLSSSHVFMRPFAWNGQWMLLMDHWDTNTRVMPTTSLYLSWRRSKTTAIHSRTVNTLNSNTQTISHYRVEATPKSHDRTSVY